MSFSKPGDIAFCEEYRLYNIYINDVAKCQLLND